MVKTNSIWPFSSLNRVPYYLAIKCFIRECNKFSEVKSIYLRHSLAEGNWVPGLSDIDLTIIIESGLNREKEFVFLVTFWKSYERLKKFFPMLGQVEVLDEELIKIWTRFTIRGYESKRWKLLYGTETISNNYVAKPERLARDAFNHALNLYRALCLRNIFDQRQASPEIKRLALKILKYIDYGANGNNELEKITDSYTMEELLCRIIMELERRVACLYINSLKSSDARSAIDRIDISVNSLDRDIGQEEMTRLSSCQGAIEAVLLVSMLKLRPFVVLKDGLDASTIKACISAVLAAFRGRMRPIILSSSVFDYLFRVQEPLKYCCGFMKSLHVVTYGRDLFSKMQPPEEDSFIKGALNYSGSIFTSLRSKKVILPSTGDNSIKNTLRIALSAKLSLEKREFVWRMDELFEKYEKFYPQYYERIAKAKENGAIRERFILLKDLADDVYTYISEIKDENKNPQ